MQKVAQFDSMLLSVPSLVKAAHFPGIRLSALALPTQRLTSIAIIHRIVCTVHQVQTS